MYKIDKTAEVNALALAAYKLNKAAKVHFKVDTGLGRLGVPNYQAISFIKKLASISNISIEGIFTTCTEHETLDNIQLERFQQVCNAK